jgi:large subunit ribosomal protein L4
MIQPGPRLRASSGCLSRIHAQHHLRVARRSALHTHSSTDSVPPHASSPPHPPSTQSLPHSTQNPRATLSPSMAIPMFSLARTREERFIARLRRVFGIAGLKSLPLPARLFLMDVGSQADHKRESVAPTDPAILPFVRPGRVKLTDPGVLRLVRPGETGTMVRLSREVFGCPIRRDIVHLCLVHHLDGLRSGTASTKTRSQVQGSGRKLHRQKGTGRARVGDARSPIRRGGGVVFGPHPRDFSTRLPRKVRAMGMRVALSDKLREGSMFVVQNLAWSGLKTKGLLERLQELEWHDGKVLFLTGEPQTATRLSMVANNLGNVEVKSVEETTIHDLLRYPRVVADLAAVAYYEAALCSKAVASPVGRAGRVEARTEEMSGRARRRVAAEARINALQDLVVRLQYHKRFGVHGLPVVPRRVAREVL